MALAMPAVKRDPKTGNWTSRIVIPADVREAFGKREDKPIWPASLSEDEASAAYGEWLRETKGKIASIRQGRVSLTDDEIRAIGAKWYRKRSTAALGVREHPATIEAVLELLAEGKSSHTVYGLMQKAAQELLQAEGISADASSRDRLADELLRLNIAHNQHQLARHKDALASDPEEARLPPSNTQPIKPRAASLTMSALFEHWAKHPEQAQIAAGTIKRYRPVFKAFAKFVSTKRASEITPDHVAAYLDGIMAKGITPKTARDVHQAGLKSVLGWAHGKRIIAANPTEGSTIKVRKARRERSKAFTNDEAQLILGAALSVTLSNIDPTLAAAQRWVPFIMAYTGCRVQEATQLRRHDVERHVQGFLYVRFTPEAGTIKDGEFREVPLHRRLEELGFWSFVANAEDGPLFYDPRKRRNQNATTPQAEIRAGDLSEWVRKDIGVTDSRVAPNHAWRHRFETAARNAGIERPYIAVCTGHSIPGMDVRYGDFELPALYREISKLTPEQVEGQPPSQAVASGANNIETAHSEGAQ